MTEMATEVTYTGSNAREVRTFVDAGVGWLETWFFTKAMSAPTDLQAWYYAKGGPEAGPEWEGARAAVYDPCSGDWLPVHAGDTIVRENGGYVVRRPS